MQKQYRQGDVWVERVAHIPKSAKPAPATNDKHILAHGEATGHHHAVSAEHCDLFRDEAGVTYLEVKEAMAALTHQEHSTIDLPKGRYVVRRQREYSPEEIRNVQD